MSVNVGIKWLLDYSVLSIHLWISSFLCWSNAVVVCPFKNVKTNSTVHICARQNCRTLFLCFSKKRLVNIKILFCFVVFVTISG